MGRVYWIYRYQVGWTPSDGSSHPSWFCEPLMLLLMLWWNPTIKLFLLLHLISFRILWISVPVGRTENTSEDINYHIYGLYGISGFLSIHWEPYVLDNNMASVQISIWGRTWCFHYFMYHWKSNSALSAEQNIFLIRNFILDYLITSWNPMHLGTIDISLHLWSQLYLDPIHPEYNCFYFTDEEIKP